MCVGGGGIISILYSLIDFWSTQFSEALSKLAFFFKFYSLILCMGGLVLKKKTNSFYVQTQEPFELGC